MQECRWLEESQRWPDWEPTGNRAVTARLVPVQVLWSPVVAELSSISISIGQQQGFPIGKEHNPIGNEAHPPANGGVVHLRIFSPFDRPGRTGT
jgi:hypothetical protein